MPSDGLQKEALERGRRATWRENLAQAADVMRSHRMRSGLLILGVAIGITTILMMVTVLTGLGRKINRDMVSASRPYITVQKFDLVIGGVDEEQLRRKELTREDAAALARECPALDDVCYMVQSNQSYRVVFRQKKTPPAPILATDESFPDIYTLHVDRGRFFTENEVRHRERVVVLGYGPAKALFPLRDPLDEFVRIGERRYKVIGTFASRHHIIGALSDNYVVIPHTAYEKDFQTKRDYVSISATVVDGKTLQDGEDEITNVLRIRRGDRPGHKSDFAVVTSDSFIDLVRKVTVPIGIALTIIASIGLLVGGIGVMNIMLISVNERTREIGVRMALGAQKRDILQQFLVEAGTLTGIGGLVGTGLGTLAAWLVSFVIHFPFEVSAFWTVTSIVFSVGVGVIFGLYPARRAASMDPVTALHYE